MKSSLTDRSSSGRRICVIGMAAAIALFCTDAVVAHDAHAGRRFGNAPRAMNASGSRAQQQQQRAMRKQAQQQAVQRPPDLPPAPVRNATPFEAPPEGGKPGRLSPDERRALRQQINDAGRDLYRPSRP